MEFHEIANVWPMMSDDDLQSLADDIKERGQLVPIYTYEGKVLDGRNRLRACQLLGIQPRVERYTGSDPIGFAFSLNEKRRHMSSAARAAIGAEMEPLYAAEAKKRVAAAGAKAAPGRPAKKGPEFFPDLSSTAKAVPFGEARESAAKAAGTNPRYVQEAKRIKEKAPEVFEKMKSGRISMQDARKAVNAIPENPWLDDETSRRVEVEGGSAVVANAKRDKNLIEWARTKGLAVDVGRGTKFGNPFVIGDDGSRDDVCDAYEKFYLPHKPSIQRDMSSLKGKVLVCWCYPERCHAESLIK